MKKVTFETKIAASRQLVWDTMLNEKTYKEWTSAAWGDSYYEGTWKQGETIRFISPDGSGTLVRLVEHRLYECSRAEHIALLKKGGEEDRTSPEAKAWIGTTEQYRFATVDGGTQLCIEMETAPEFEPMFAESWPKALAKLKEMCER